ncbi:MAG TPA: hypothetical protein VGG90_07805 [Candidatus Dormibacteraeota bacterium]
MSAVRATVLVILAAGLLAACGYGSAAPASHAPSTCSGGYSSNSPVINLAVRDNGRSIVAHPCDSIWVVLAGPSDPAWEFVQTSDPGIVAVVPLPLPHPPDGGIEAVFLAKRTGVAELSSYRPAMACPAGAMCLPPPRWAVSVTVVS